MSIRFTEEEAKQLGFVKGKNGEWIAPAKRPDRRPLLDAGAPGKAPERERLEQSSESLGALAARECRKKKGGRRFSKPRPRFRIRLVVYTHREIDPDNVYAKWIIDHFVANGVLPGDGCRNVARVIKEAVLIPKTEPQRTLAIVEERYEARRKGSTDSEAVDDGERSRVGPSDR